MDSNLATFALVDRLADKLAVDALGAHVDPLELRQLGAALRDEAFSVLLGLHTVRLSAGVRIGI